MDSKVISKKIMQAAFSALDQKLKKKLTLEAQKALDFLDNLLDQLE